MALEEATTAAVANSEQEATAGKPTEGQNAAATDEPQRPPREPPQPGATIEYVDYLFEQHEIVKLKEVPMDHADASRLIIYLRSLGRMAATESDRSDAEIVSFCLSLSHGFLCAALEIALKRNELQLAKECLDITKNVANKPSPGRLTPTLRCGQWSVVGRVSYDYESEEEEKACREAVKRQIVLDIARARMPWTLEELELENEPERAELDQILRREDMTKHFEYIVKELDVVEPKSTDHIFKTDPADGAKKRSRLDAASSALATAYVSAFVHAGFSKDLHLSNEGNTLIQRTKEQGTTAATAAIGLMCLWNAQEGLTQVDQFQYSSDTFVRAGAMLAFGLNSCNTRNECDPVLNLVPEALESTDVYERLAAYLSLGYAYIGTGNERVRELLVPIVLDLQAAGGLEISSAAALALGMVFRGMRDEAVAEALLETLLERGEKGIDTVHVYGLAIGLALLYIGAGDKCDCIVEALRGVAHPIGEFTSVLLQGCAYAGCGDVLIIQRLMNHALSAVTRAREAEEQASAVPEGADPASGVGLPVTTEQPAAEAAGNAAAAAVPTELPPMVAEEERVPLTAVPPPGAPVTSIVGGAAAETAPESGEAAARSAIVGVVREAILEAIPGVAVLALPLVAMGDEIGAECLMRLFSHFLQFDGLLVKRSIPLALMVHSVSNPRPAVVELLTKLSHDADADTALHAIIALGVVGSGTNNARIAQTLRQLSVYYSAEASALFLVKLAQGLLHCGKGLHSLSPLHHDRSLLDYNALSGLIAFATQALFTKDTLCQGRYHMNMFYLTPSIHPRWLVTVDANLSPVPVTVRVGQAVETAGLAGQPKKLTGFRTHETPVLLAYDEKAEIGTGEWQAMTDCLEGIVVVRPLTGKNKAQATKALD